MQKKIKSIDWDKAASDVAPFLNVQDRKTLNLWGVDFFMDKLRACHQLSHITEAAR